MRFPSQTICESPRLEPVPLSTTEVRGSDSSRAGRGSTVDNIKFLDSEGSLHECARSSR